MLMAGSTSAACNWPEMKINRSITAESLRSPLERMFELSAPKILALEKSWDSTRGTPVFTVKGKYTTRGWTEWTRGFQFGSALLQFDATGEAKFLDYARTEIARSMATHVS